MNRPTRNRVPTYKVAKSTLPAPLATPRATPRASSRPTRPRARQRTEELVTTAQKLAVDARVLPTPASVVTQVVRDSVPPALPPTQPLARRGLIFEEISSPPPAATIEEFNIQPTSHQQEEEEQEVEEEEIDYDIEWKVVVDRHPIDKNIIARSGFYISSLRSKAKAKA